MSWPDELHTALILNAIASFTSAAFAAAALRRPGFLSGSSKIEAGEVFYVRMYAARSIPFELTAGILPFCFESDAAVWVLFTAALIQALDIMIAAKSKQRGMAIGAAIAAIVHLVCALAIHHPAGTK